MEVENVNISYKYDSVTGITICVLQLRTALGKSLVKTVDRRDSMS